MSSELRFLWESAGGRVPLGWRVVPLESLLRDSKGIAVGVMYPGPDTPGGIPLIKVGDITDGVIHTRPSYCISETTNYEYRRTQLEGDELLITLVGNPGECVVVQPYMKGWNPARAIAALRLRDASERMYLKTVLESSAGKHLIDAVLNTTVQKTLNLKDIKRLPIPLPPPETVKSITQLAEALASRIALLRETNVTLEAIAQALFKSWFVDFDPIRAKQEKRTLEGMNDATAALFPEGFEETEIGVVPTGWRLRSVYELATYINGAAYKAFEPNGERRGLPIIKIAELKSGVTEQTAYSDVSMPDKYRIRLGDILFSWSGNPDTSIDTFVWHRDEAWLNQHIFRVLPHRTQERAFLLQLLRHLRPTFAELARNKQTTGLGHVTVADMKRLMVVYPDEKLIELFSESVGSLHAAIFENHRQAAVLSELRATLLPRLISGQLRLSEAEALVA